MAIISNDIVAISQVAGNKRRIGGVTEVLLQTSSKRPRRSEKSSVGTSQSKSHRAEVQINATLAQDIDFLAEMQRQLKKVKSSRKKPRSRIYANDIDTLQPFLKVMKPVLSQRVGLDSRIKTQSGREPVDAFFLSPADGHRLLGSNEAVHVPVFVQGGAKALFDHETDDRRPIEQIFDFLHDPDEAHGTDVVGRRAIGMLELRKHFLEQRSSKNMPWNFPDIPNPRLDHGLPAFIDTSNCTFLHGLMRWLTDVQATDVCYPDCPQRSSKVGDCERHFMSSDELLTLEMLNRHWRSSLMLGDPGAITHSHYDKYGLGTWIACHEGEYGFAWLSHPTPSQRVAWQHDNTKPCGRLVYTVLRKGDVVHMPPGLVHIVFRLPEGGQTLGVGGHLIRQPDLGQWLEMIGIEMDRTINKPDDNPYHLLYPSVLKAIDHFINGDVSPEEVETYGGVAALKAAQIKLASLEEKIPALLASRV